MESLIQTLSNWSYLFLFGMVFFECAGLPLPGLSVALIAAALAGQDKFFFPLVFGLTLASASLGGMAGYGIGTKGGRAFLERYGPLFRITPQRLALAEKSYQKHGSKAVLFGRYLPVLCFLGGILSGMGRLPFRRFVVYNFTGALLWCTTHLVLGFTGGKSLHLLFKALNNVFFAFVLACILVGAALFIRYKIRSHRRSTSVPTSSQSSKEQL